MSKPDQTVLIVSVLGKHGSDYEHYLRQDPAVSYKVLTEQDSSEVLARCRSQQVDGLILELDSDRRLSLIEQLKQQLEHCPPIVVVGSDVAATAVSALKKGAVDYLVRAQITADSLRLAVREAIAHAQVQNIQLQNAQMPLSGQTIPECVQIEALLQESQAQLQQQLAEIEAIYQLAPVGLAVLDCNLRFVRVNQRLAEINGLTVEAHIGHTVRELLPEVAESAEAILQSVLNTGEPLLEVEIKGETPARPGVQRIWLENFLPLKRGDQIVGINIVCEEVTERIQIEAALYRSEERFRHMADHAPMMIWVTDATGYCTYLSQSWYSFTGQNEATGLGFGWLEAVHPDDRQVAQDIFVEATQRQESFRLEYRLRRQDGEYCWSIDAASPWFSEAGKFEGFIGSVIDISDRKQIEQALIKSESHFRGLAENISQLAWMTDSTGWIFWYNQRWFDYTGTTLEEMQGWGWQQVHHPEHVERVVKKASRCFEQGEAWEDTFPLRGQDGQYRWFLSRVTPVHDQQGQVLCWFGTNTDITNLRQAEIELQQTTERLDIALKSAPITLFNQDLALRYTWVHNPTHRYSAAEMIGRQDAELVSPESAAQLTQLKRQVIATGIGLRAEVTVARDQQVFHYDLTVDPLRDENNTIIGITCAAVDISQREQLAAERKQARTSLQRSEDRLRMAIAAARLGTWDWNLVTNELLWDAGCKAMFGLPAEAETSLEVFSEALHPEDRDRMEQIIEWALNPASSGDYDAEYRTIGIQDQIERWIAAKGQVYVDADGNPQRFIGTVLDITEQKQAEAEREQILQREQAAREEAERANRIKDEFLAVLSHELRSRSTPSWAGRS
ncbi:MAG: PAS domain S-box protein [Leptolyngbyaceae cyanobacterium RM1_1_2]|nr:PAS domain S-box protein [Leptolyngbyaceae cyanobacterium RM1_1_2]